MKNQNRIERIALYPGTFDPVTNGHLDIIRRSSILFDTIYVSVLKNLSKAPLFDIETRKQLIRDALGDISNVEVTHFDGLAVDYVEEIGACAIIRGLRAISDYEYEYQIASMNRKLNKKVETVFFMTDNKYSFLSSSIIKQVVRHGGKVTDLVPPVVEDKLLCIFSGGNRK